MLSIRIENFRCLLTNLHPYCTTYSCIVKNIAIPAQSAVLYKSFYQRVTVQTFSAYRYSIRQEIAVEAVRGYVIAGRTGGKCQVSFLILMSTSNLNWDERSVFTNGYQKGCVKNIVEAVRNQWMNMFITWEGNIAPQQLHGQKQYMRNKKYTNIVRIPDVADKRMMNS